MSDYYDGPTVQSDSYTEISTQSWFSRIAQSLVGLIVGPIVVLIGIGLLVWNEDRAVTTARSLAEGMGAIISVDAAMPQPQNDGHLVHVAGPVTATARLSDPEFHLLVADLTLHRTVEMLQWHEREESHSEKNLGGSTTTVKTYTYTRDWSTTRIDSSRFKHPEGHQNPAFAISSRVIAAKDARLGGFHVADSLLSRLPANEPIAVDANTADALKARLARPVTDFDNGLFVGNDPSAPQIGDLKIRFSATPAGEATVIAEQRGSEFAGYQTHAGDVLQEIRLGHLSPKQIFAEMESENTILTWAVRLFATVDILIGFVFFFGPISVLADIVPFVGGLVGMGTFFLAFMLTVIVAPVTIALAWLAFRPLVSIAVLGGGLVGALAVRFLWPAKRPPLRSPSMPPPPMPVR